MPPSLISKYSPSLLSGSPSSSVSSKRARTHKHTQTILMVNSANLWGMQEAEKPPPLKVKVLPLSSSPRSNSVSPALTPMPLESGMARPAARREGTHAAVVPRPVNHGLIVGRVPGQRERGAGQTELLRGRAPSPRRAHLLPGTLGLRAACFGAIGSSSGPGVSTLQGAGGLRPATPRAARLARRWDARDPRRAWRRRPPGFSPHLAAASPAPGRGGSSRGRRLFRPRARHCPRREERKRRRPRSRSPEAPRTARRAPSDLGARQDPRRQEQEPGLGKGRPWPACRALRARRLHPAAANAARAAECVAPAEVRVRRGGCARAG